MKLNVVLFAIVVGMLAACGGGGGGGGSGASDDDDFGSMDISVNPVSPVAPADPVGSDNTRPITTAFNGFMLSEARIVRDGRSDLVRLYRYDSDQREIMVFNTSGENATFENADLRRIIELNAEGLPETISVFSGDSITQVDSHIYDTAGRLESRTLEIPGLDLPPRRLEYRLNANGQLITEATVDVVSGLEESRTEYTYSSDGNLINGRSAIFNMIFSTDFNNDQLNRVSGWMSIDSISDNITTGTYTYDENNNITSVEVVDSSGILSRTINYSYVEIDESIYNLIWFDYLYSPQID